ncbi:MAG TPA: FAD-dependent oxidoreductase [Candidatus Acidoferrales bacterium]|nr:FAD-dependent oxidoreductase [Candidatus Acidoferrales bacterium]
MSDRRHEFEIAVVGAGPAGLSAACVAAEAGRRVALLDDTPWLGGQVWRGEERHPGLPQAKQWFARFRRSGVTLLDQTSVIASPRQGVLLAEHPAGPREIRFQKLILATGARELLLPFPGWTLPGVMGPGGLQALVKNGWPVAGKKIVVCGTGPLLPAAADGLKKHGANIICIAEQTPKARLFRFGTKLLGHPAKFLQAAQIKLRLSGIPFLTGVWPVRAEGADRVQSVTLTDGQKSWTEACDLLACGFHLAPNVELPLALGCALSDDFVRVNEWQATSVENVFCAGEPTGIGGADCALAEGRIAGHAAAENPAEARRLFAVRARWHRFRLALAEAFSLRPAVLALAADDTIFCRCEDVTLGRVKQFPGWRNAKLHTRCGMGACQGRICGAAAKALFGAGMESVRPPVFPARISSLLTLSASANTLIETKPTL